MTRLGFAERPAHLPRTAFLFSFLLILIAPNLRAADRVPIQITAYNIDAELKPETHMLTCVTRVTFTDLDPVQTAVFDLHGALKVDKVTDSKNVSLSGERGAEASLRITPAQPLIKGQTYTWTFYYSGALETDAGGPVDGLKLAIRLESLRSEGGALTLMLFSVVFIADSAGRWFLSTLVEFG
jgi:hypothetical protein